MPQRDFTIVFQADTTAAIAGMKALENEFKLLEAFVTTAGSAVQGLNGQVNGLGQTLNSGAVGFQHAGTAARGFAGEMLAMSAAFLVIEGGVKAIGNLGEMANKTREHIKEMAIDTMDLRDRLRELANLKGADGPDNEIAGETIKMGIRAGMMPDEMRKYIEQFEGSIPAGEQKGHIDERTKKDLAEEGARFGTRVKLSPQTAGDLAGVIPQYTDLTKDKAGRAIPMDDRVGLAMAQMGRVAYGLNEGRGNLEPLARSLINTAGAVVSMGGPVEDLAELAAIQGVASTHANPKEAGTRVRQAVRALRDTKGDTGMFFKGDAKFEESDTHVERLEKLKPLIDAARAKGKGPDQYLRDAGFTNDDEMRAVIEQVEDLGVIKQRIAAGRAITGQSVMEANKRFLTSDRAGLRRTQMANKAGQEFLLGESHERIEMGKENAEQEMKAKHELGGGWNNFAEFAANAGGLRQFLGFEAAREGWKYERAEKNLIDEAEKRGMTRDEARTMLGYRQQTSGFGKGTWEAPQDHVKGFNALATEVERRLGTSVGHAPNLAPKFDDLIKETRETNKILREQRDPAAVAARARAIRDDMAREAGRMGIPPAGPIDVGAVPRRP